MQVTSNKKKAVKKQLHGLQFTSRTIRQLYTRPIGPSAPFAAIYDNKVKQHGAYGEYAGI